MAKNLIRAASLIVLILAATLVIGFQFSKTTIAAEPTITTTPVHVWFREDFSTRANRWFLVDLGAKAKIDFDESTTPSTFTLQAQPANYALWTYPDTDLKLDHFDMQADLTFNSTNKDDRAGIILNYASDSDMIVAAVSPEGDVSLGHYFFGIWSDLVPPTKITLDPSKLVTMDVAVRADRTATIFVNGQAVGATTFKTFKSAGFGLFALSGKAGGINVSFHRFVVSDI